MTGTSKSTNEFISDIYSTIVDANQWMEILNHTAHIAGAKAANVCLIDHVTEELNSQFMCTETNRFFPVYMQSPHMAVELKAVARLPHVQTTTEFYETNNFVQQANEIFTDDPMDLTESEEWLYNEWSIRNRHICRLNIHPCYMDMHTLLFDDQTETKRLEGINKVKQLTPHFAKAIEISRPFLLLKSRFQATLDVLDRFQLAVFIISPNGAVVLRNTAADRILDLSDSVSIDARGHLKSDLGKNTASMGKLINEILRQQQSGDIRQSTEVILHRRSQQNPYLVEITPLSEQTVIGRTAGLMIIMIDPDHKKIINTKGMQSMFGLSKAETNICQLLAEGYSTHDMADARNVSPITVKNQVKSLLEKTGNRSRSDLIRQALSINLPVDDRTSLNRH